MRVHQAAVLAFAFLAAFAGVGCSSTPSESSPAASHVGGAEVGTVRFRLTNTTAQPLFAVLDNDHPRQLSVDGVSYATSPYLADLCDGDGTHDDPHYTVVRVEPSTSIEWVWGARTAGAAGIQHDDARSCSTVAHVPAASYTAHACLLSSEPPRPNMDLTNLPRVCRDSIAVVPVTGEAVVSFAF
jgi:hypothetical protein